MTKLKNDWEKATLNLRGSSRIYKIWQILKGFQ